MIKFRPHKGGLAESLALAKEFNTVDDMYSYIEVEEKEILDWCSENRNSIVDKQISEQRIYIDSQARFDDRCGWNTRYVSSYGNYIGMCDLGDKDD